MNKQNNERVYICVDDTDDLTKATSTGAIADEIAGRLCARFGCEINMGITRHQLLLDERVPYTSHNSSMGFDVVLPAGSAPEADEIGWDVIRSMRAENSNPGLCVLPVHEDTDYGAVINFGQRAKNELITIEEAADTAKLFPGMILKSEGATGQGMIGALAGVGLRMTGNDGRFRGKYDLSETAGGRKCSAEKLSKGFFQRYGTAPVFIDQNGKSPEPHDIIKPVPEAKAVLRNGRLTFLCEAGGNGEWKPFSKDEFNKKRRKKEACESYETDPDKEERFHEKEKRSCGSCLYRRLTADGYICMAGRDPGGSKSMSFE